MNYKELRKVYTGGTFDLFHAGHVRFLRNCKKIAGPDGSVIVSLNTDEFIEEYKGQKPIYSYQDRLEILMSCSFVSNVIENSGGKDSKKSILSVAPNFIVVGSDWAKKDYYAQMGFSQDWLDEHNITLAYVPYTERISSSKIKTLL